MKSNSPVHLVSLALLFVALTVRAEDMTSDGNLRVNGFITQGYFQSDHNNIYGNSEDGSLDFRELAVNGSWRPRSDLLLAGQLMSRRAGNVNDGSPQVDYLLLDWRMQDDQETQSGIRLGRLKVPYGFYNDTRDVAFTRPSILLPQEIYYDMSRDIALSVDGAGIYRQGTTLGLNLDLDMVVGVPKHDAAVEYPYLGGDMPGKFESGIAAIGRLMLADPLERWRVGVSLLSFDLDYEAFDDPVPALLPGDGRLHVDIAVLSAQMRYLRWAFTAEYMLQHIDWSELGGVVALKPEVYLEAYYLQAQYHFLPRWDLILRYGEAYLDRDDRGGRGFQARLAELGIAAQPAVRYAQDLTLGIGWQPAPNWLLRAEWHRVQGTLWLPGQDNPDTAQLRRNWNLFALQATYRF
ncbi:hypothetical protein [Marinobacterium rhizophilum]|uniref:hypothetical protein n=1 Tax=Marinobacterium rhizophilum TaxID=420402 RepID=UPI0012ECB8F3|nr:hypothetical protein [Marinobacterium rhizophilum]